MNGKEFRSDKMHYVNLIGFSMNSPGEKVRNYFFIDSCYCFFTGLHCRE